MMTNGAVAQKPAEEVKPGLKQKVVVGAKKVIGKLKPKQQPVLTNIPETAQMELFSGKADEIYEQIKYMEVDDAVKLMEDLYKYLNTYPLNKQDANNIEAVITRIAGERPDAWDKILGSNKKISLGLKQLVGEEAGIALKYTIENLQKSDILIIVNVLADKEAKKGKDITEIFGNIGKRFSVEFPTSTQAWLFGQWLENSIIGAGAITEQMAVVEGRILGKLGLDPKNTKFAGKAQTVFMDNLGKLAESADPKAYLFSVMKNKTYLKSLEEHGEKELADIIKKSDGFDGLVKALTWEETIPIIGKGEHAGPSKLSPYHEFGAWLEKSADDLAPELESLKVLRDLAKKYNVKSQVVKDAATLHSPILTKEWAKSYGRWMKEKGALLGKALFWPALKAGKIPKTPKGYISKGKWWGVQVLYLGVLLGAVGGAGYLGYKKITKKAVATKKEKIGKLRAYLEKKKAKPTEKTLGFLVSEGAPVWAFIKTKHPAEKLYPDTPEKAKMMIDNPEAGGYYFSYPRINEFVTKMEELSKKNPGKDMSILLNEHFKEFTDDGFFIAHGNAFVIAFCQDLDLPAKTTNNFLKHPQTFLKIYSAVIQGIVPRCYVAAYKEKALEKASKQFGKGEVLITPGSLMDLLDQYTTAGLIELKDFNEFAKNNDLFNTMDFGKGELIYGDVSGFAFTATMSPDLSKLELRSRDIDMDTPYFIAPKEIGQWDLRFLGDPDAVRFVMKYSTGERGLLKVLGDNAKSIDAYKFVKYLMKIENLLKTYKEPAKLEKYVQGIITSKEGKKFISLGKLSLTPADIFAYPIPEEKEKPPKKKKPKKKKKAAPKPKEKPKEKPEKKKKKKPKEKKAKPKKEEEGGF